MIIVISINNIFKYICILFQSITLSKAYKNKLYVHRKKFKTVHSYKYTLCIILVRITLSQHIIPLVCKIVPSLRNRTTQTIMFQLNPSNVT